MKRLFFFTTFALLVAVASSGADTGWMGQDGSDIRRAIQDALPRQAIVIFVQDNEVYLDVTKENGAAVGRKYVVERPGAEIRHPVTGELMGRATTRVAEVQITWVQSGFSRAKVIGTPAEGGIHVKDVARLSEEPVVVRFPVRHADGTLSKLTEAVDAELADILSKIDGATMKVGPTVSGTPQTAAAIAPLVPDASLALIGRVDGSTVEVTVVNVASGSALKTFKVPVPDAMKALAAEKLTPASMAPPASTPSPAPGANTPAPPSQGPSSFTRLTYQESGEVSAALNFVPIDMTTGDVDGDGIDELIFADNKTIRIFRIKLDGALEEIGKSSVGWASSILHITACDLDGDGKAEIYVVEKPGNYVSATGFRWNNGRLEKFFHEADLFLRALRTQGNVVLYGQKYGSTRPFDRGILKYRFAGGKLVGASSGLPPAFTVYDFAPIGTTGYIASIDFENKLRLYNQAGDIVWTGPETYGGSDIRIESGDKRNSIEERTGVATADLDGDGVEELLVVQNLLEGASTMGFIRIGALQQYKSGRIVALALSGGGLNERWVSKTYNGLIKGFTVANPLARGPEAVFYTLEKISFSTKHATLRVIPLH